MIFLLLKDGFRSAAVMICRIRCQARLEESHWPGGGINRYTRSVSTALILVIKAND